MLMQNMCPWLLTETVVAKAGSTPISSRKSQAPPRQDLPGTYQPLPYRFFLKLNIEQDDP
jgi:hypothetical protein